MEFMDETDLLVLPSKFETFGTVAFEAMARRRLVLVSPNCGIAQWPELEPGLFQMHEGETLTKAIERLSQMDPAARFAAAETGAAAARAFARHTIDQWVDVLYQAVREKRFS
jgi:glycosyltransferase involved in cell wall biosynthesis